MCFFVLDFLPSPSSVSYPLSLDCLLCWCISLFPVSPSSFLLQFLLIFFFLVSFLFSSYSCVCSSGIAPTRGVTHVTFPYRDEDVGSVVCLCTRACLIKCSFKAVCTSAGISGEVWLILIAGSIAFGAVFISLNSLCAPPSFLFVAIVPFIH